jgi:hypothetical protein
MALRAGGLLCGALLGAGALIVRAAPAGALSFTESPALPVLPTVTINGGAQTAKTTMTNFSVTETFGESSGWNVTVNGQSGTERSAVFAQYCPNTLCGSSPKGYVSGGFTLAAGSLTLNSTGASFTGGSGTTPTLVCSTACNVDNATAVKIASRASGSSFGSTWKTTGFSSSSLSLSVKSTLRSLPASEVYRVNILWTLSTGP